ncbi:transmembrane protein 41A [Folsomia candida]|uniref:Transmembrane protein 41A n=1 Tax=Folsomia candida TaxID=158441 RepID=A0A226DE03_FOLCA|nr:transmembrane protein 41A [Folsomia candida]OXA43393.1 Transmembrane protein 41A [Folsomia candida]
MVAILRNSVTLILLILAATGFIYFLYYLSGPDSRLQLPRDLKHLLELKEVLEEYATKRVAYTVLFFSSVYLYKQTFAIPGSVFLNLMSGALFGVLKGFPLCCFLSACGASSCFLVSKYFGKEILVRYAPHRVAYFQKMVEKRREERALFKFLVSIRVFPMSPNWLINMCSPIVGVPLGTFFLSVLLGLAPYNFLTVNAGSALADLDSLDDIISLRVAFGLGLLAVGILNPFKLLNKFRRPNIKATSSTTNLLLPESSS